jgi:peptidoglycan/LPS O-acetylase OafA/YrhL
MTAKTTASRGARGVATMPSRRIPSLDGLRAISIIFVIVGHLWGHPGAPVLLSALGVHVFFVLSGYLITGLLQKEYERAGRINLVAFYKRRCFRIFPAAFTYILIVAILSPATRGGLAYAITYTASYHPTGMPLLFQHLWSLSVEEQFYLLWPLALLLGFRHRAWIAGFGMLAAAMFRLAIVLQVFRYPMDYLHFSFFGTMDSIAAGCLLAIYEPEIRKRCLWMAPYPAIAIAIPVTIWVLETSFWGNLSVLWGAVPLLIAFWIFLLIERKDWILNNPVSSTIGALSYSLYLWQQPFAVEHKSGMFLGILTMSACALGSYLLVEKPMLRLGAAVNIQKLKRSLFGAAFQLRASE